MKSMTKVTFLTGEYPPMQGGIGDYTALLARHLQALGIESSILISRKYNKFQVSSSEFQVKASETRNPKPETRNQKPETQNPKPETQNPKPKIHPAVQDWGHNCWKDVKRHLTAHPTDVLHIQYQAAAFDLKGWLNWLPWYLRRWKQRPKIVVTFHDLRIPYLFPKAGPLRWRSVLALAKYSDAVICTNAEDAAALRDYSWGVHVHQIPLGNNAPVNPPPGYDRRAWRKKLGFGDDAFVLAYFGFLNESKGGEDLIAVLDALTQRGVNAYLLMIGGDVGDSDPRNANYARRVRRMIEARGLIKRIRTTGYVDLPQVSAHLLAADAALMPYRDGVSFRRTTLIAVLSHGLPIISARPAIELPQIIPGKNMLLAPSGDIPALTNAALRVVNDVELRQTLGAGAADLGKRFDWDTIAAETAKVYGST